MSVGVCCANAKTSADLTATFSMVVIASGSGCQD